MFRSFLIVSLLIALGNSEKVEASDMDAQCTEVLRADHGGKGISVCNGETLTCDGLYWDGKDASQTFLTADENHVALECMQARFRILKPVFKRIQSLLRFIQCGALATNCAVVWSQNPIFFNILHLALFWQPFGKAVTNSYLRKGTFSFDQLYALPEFQNLAFWGKNVGYFYMVYYLISLDEKATLAMSLNIPPMIVAGMGFPIEWIENALAAMDTVSDGATKTSKMTHEPTTIDTTKPTDLTS